MIVEAIKLMQPITLADGARGESGDWLVTNAEGYQVVMSDAEFTEMYVPAVADDSGYWDD